ncbi:MAG: hypothetical protein JST84_21630 [Acidobacteria bacterium]|nr:hypothetical protein [Acidobacteriota bacterium]
MKDLITQIGWHILFIAGEFKAAGWSWSPETARRKVILRITAQSTAAKYNCVEIRQIEMKKWLGLTRIGITAQARQIQVTGMLPPGRARISYASE